jgi:hypothetical protein
MLKCMDGRDEAASAAAQHQCVNALTHGWNSPSKRSSYEKKRMLAITA